MSLPVSVYLESFQSRRGIFLTWLVKVLIILLCLLGMFSIYKQVVLTLGQTLEREDVTATEDRRDRVYENRRNLSLSVCEQYQEEITLHTVKMFDLVPPAPIGLNADMLVDKARQFYWCKVQRTNTVNTKISPDMFQVPKAASTSWISLLLSDREFSNLAVSIGRQHMYLR